MESKVNERIAEIKERTDKSTPGPWTMAVDSCRKCTDEGKEGEFTICELPSGYHAMLELRVDAEFIAASREDVPYLLALVQAQERERITLVAALQDYETACQTLTDKQLIDNDAIRSAIINGRAAIATENKL